MNAEYKQKWLDALRSGKYKQIHGQLEIPGKGFCCLGVLCDVVKEDAGLERKEITEIFEGEPTQTRVYYGPHGFDSPELDSDYLFLPIEVVELTGIGTQNPTVKYQEDEEIALYRLNDEKKLSFSDIANLIEEQL